MSELYELPAGWEWKKLGTVLNVQNGYAFDSKLFSEEIGEQLIRIRDLKNGFKTVSKFTGSYDEKFIVRKNDFLIGMDGDFVCYRWKGENSLLNQRVCRLIDFESSLNANYIFYGINKFLDDIHKVTAFVTVKHISSKQIKEINFPVPPLKEQTRIVSKLDTLFEKIDKSIALHQKNMDEADVFMGSVLNDVFGELEEKYEKQVWNEVLKIKNGKHYKDVIDDNGQYPIYGSGGIMNYANDYLCNENTVIIGRKGTINNPLFVKEKFWNIDTAFGIEANKDVLLPMFLFYFSKHFNFLDLNKSTTLPSLAKTHLLQIMMVLPPLNIQQKILTYLDKISKKIEKIKSVQKEKMESLVALKASILDQAFRGEL